MGDGMGWGGGGKVERGAGEGGRLHAARRAAEQDEVGDAPAPAQRSPPGTARRGIKPPGAPRAGAGRGQMGSTSPVRRRWARRRRRGSRPPRRQRSAPARHTPARHQAVRRRRAPGRGEGETGRGTASSRPPSSVAGRHAHRVGGAGVRGRPRAGPAQSGRVRRGIKPPGAAARRRRNARRGGAK